ncbi:MAG: hypothetical protein WA951_02585 [Leeuwenhoekiella sp.]
MKTFYISLIIMLLFTTVFSQEVKNEVEKRIEKQEMPSKALELLESMPVNMKKAKFYNEKDNEHSSYEAKVKYKNRKYSIEFDNSGALHDIEVLLDFDKLPKNTAKTIKNYLKTTYERHKIEKTQQQYSPANFKNAFEKDIGPDKYELIVATKNKENELEKREILFDSNGKELSTRKVIRNSYDFLLF